MPAPVWGWTAVLVAAALLLVLADRPGGLLGLDRAVAEVTGPQQPHRGATRVVRVGTVLGYRCLWLPTALVLVWTARWRHLLVYLGTVSVVAAVAQLAEGQGVLVRAVRAEVTGTPAAVEFTAWPVVVLATVSVATLYVLTPSGRARRWGWGAVAALVMTAVVLRVVLGLDGPSVAIAAALLGGSAAALVCTVLAPEAAFPVGYRRRVSAHLALDAARTARIRAAVRDQLGVAVTAIEPFRLDGSAGSTPCRLTTAAGPDLFGKLYSITHLRSDRWYKLLRVLRYGRLEDEAPFSSVRRLVEHEDYMLRLLRDGGVRVPEPMGVVEVVPGREYLLVTELVPRTVEIRRSRLDDAVIDDALRQIALLWSAGAAHRDVKPSNVLVQDEARVVLVDVSFGELRPSRWRQAADLAGMLFTCALVAGPERVLDGARRQFTDAELSESVAATSPLTLPTQLRRMLAADGRDVVGRCRALLPSHPRIRVQRWSARRVLLTLATAGGVAAAVVLAALNLRAGGLL
ncbi:Lipopolysaccharide kinase (Kdo/WaaP) family protein [Geodermatophilus aquaeductus]|uniref:Lipopolysaccharide kinase (Kdo/WaaP) family protein n=1 Tax=Geodermatophilus aquaeductus TaxID=1564161 RepID=A0A521FUY0_9ACTN|nr:Lipopolysaccharide kinase (Kdo/WaaP) family protein [Geodermatophilus aquaeductus]